jgi:hypothetical protein
MLSPVDKLLAIEEIKTLKARYVRYVDSHDWANWRKLLADDAIFGPVEPDPEIGKAWQTSGVEAVWDHPRIEGADAITAWISQGVVDLNTVHMAFLPEIEILSQTEARGIWAMEDILRFPGGRVIQGYGYYRETYVRPGDAWLIKSFQVLRKAVELKDAKTTGLPIV